MKKLLIAAMALIITGCSGPPAVVEPEIQPVAIRTETMKTDQVEHLYRVFGEVVPANRIDLYTAGGGYIEGVDVTAGETVSLDQVVIRLDDSDANYASYNATESQLRTARDNLRAQLDIAQNDLARQQTLFDAGAISRQTLDQFVSNVDSLQRQYNNAQVSYSNELRSLRDSLQDSVKNRIIASPIEGKVAAVYVKEGQAVNNQMAMSIIDDSQLYVETFIAGDLRKGLNVGDAVRLYSDSGDSYKDGSVYEIDEVPDMNTRLFEVLISIDTPNGYVVGDYMEVAFVTDTYEAYMVPTQAIMRSGSSQYVYLLADEAPTKTLVQTGKTKGEWVEVTNLNELYEVVVKGQNQLTADVPFTLVNE